MYWLEADAQERHINRLWQAPGVPIDPPLRPERYIAHLPQHCVYVALPQMDRPVEAGPLSWPLGVFVHLEHDVANGGRPEIRIVVDTDGTWEGLMPHPVLLDRPTLLASSRELAQGSLGAVLERLPDLGGSEDTTEALAKFGQTVSFQVWPVVEAVTDPEVVISRWDMPGKQPDHAQPVKDGGGPRWGPANDPTRWRVSLTAAYGPTKRTGPPSFRGRSRPTTERSVVRAFTARTPAQAAPTRTTSPTRRSAT
ncbi:hypothetical protein AB0942_33985 [Streptomyces nodosus]|uniref:hypothetical protein n=1 Tax=Streptomyces nodosus TaxID=40318 RepID=UPI0034524B44